MKHLRRFLTLTMVLLFAAGIVLNFGGCSKEFPLEPQITGEEDTEDFPSTLSKKGDNFPQYAEHTFKFDKKKGYYKGGMLNTTNGSKFKIKDGDLTPPPGWTDGKGKKHRKNGDPITITMTVDKIKVDKEEQIVFTFEPSGCTFSPSAELTLSWKGLKAKKHEDVTLALIEHDPAFPDKIGEPIGAYETDTRGQKFLMWIDHFSRYAISKGR